MKKAHIKELERINASIPKELLEKIQKEQLVTPTMKEVAEKALVSDLPKEKKDRIYRMLKSGVFDKTELVSDPEIEKQVSQYLDEQIELSQKAGRLPKNLKLGKKAMQRVKRQVKE